MRKIGALLLALLWAAPLSAQAQDDWRTAVEVDVELLLLVDVSRSMSPRELDIQRRGYAAALTSDAVLAVIGDGFIGNIAVAYVEWAGDGNQRVVAPWQLLRTRADAEGFAGRILAHTLPGMRRTSISSALRNGALMFEGNGYIGLRQVIDISGDGPNNEGGDVRAARDAVLAQGIVVNGLPLMTDEGVGGQWHLDDLDQYYASCVTGGPGSFVLPVTEWSGFADAVRRKLVMEISGVSPPAQPGPAQGARIVPTSGRAVPGARGEGLANADGIWSSQAAQGAFTLAAAEGAAPGAWGDGLPAADGMRSSHVAQGAVILTTARRAVQGAWGDDLTTAGGMRSSHVAQGAVILPTADRAAPGAWGEGQPDAGGAWSSQAVQGPFILAAAEGAAPGDRGLGMPTSGGMLPSHAVQHDAPVRRDGAAWQRQVTERAALRPGPVAAAGTGPDRPPVGDTIRGVWAMESGALVAASAALRRPGRLQAQAGPAGWPQSVQFTAAQGGYDCLVGEKIWQQYRDGWEP